MGRTTVWMMICLVWMVTSAEATIRFVSQTGSGQYTTITAAHAAAASGDTLLIGPGTYSEAGINSTKRLVWLGAGWDQTYIQWSTGQWYVNTAAASGTVIEGLRVTTSNADVVAIVNNADSVSIRRCYFEKLGTGGNIVVSAGGSVSRIYVEDCILVQNGNNSIVTVPNAASLFRNSLFFLNYPTTSACLYSGSGLAGTTELYNNVFLNVRMAFNLVAGSQPVVAVNNVFYDWGSTPTFGTYPVSSTFDYNASETVAAPGTNGISITADPFVNYDETLNYQHGVSDLHLAVGSALINAGHPSLLDPDSSRSDCGIYGGPRPLIDGGVPNYPWAVNIVLSPNLVGQGTPVNASALGRVGPQY